MNLLNAVWRQNDIAELLVLQQKHSLFPSREIPVFDRDPLNFHPFMQAFEHGIEDNTDNNRDRLYYLEQFASGQPKELVQSCLHMDTRRGYAEVKKLLKCHFGDEVKITSAYMEKALSWSSIKTDDGKALNAYALYLRGCCNAAEDLPNMLDLDLPSNLKRIISKLPYKLLYVKSGETQHVTFLKGHTVEPNSRTWLNLLKKRQRYFKTGSSALPGDLKHQVILPKNSHLSTLLLTHIHQTAEHCGKMR